MKILAKMSAKQESELLAELSFQCLFNDYNPVNLWNRIRRYTDEEGKKRRKELRKKGYIVFRKIQVYNGHTTEKSLYLLCNEEKESKPSGNGVLNNGPTIRTIQPLTKGPAYLGEFTRESWNKMASQMGLPRITTMGNARLQKLSTRFKECFGKPESIWEEVIDGVAGCVKKYPDLKKVQWLDFDYVVASQKNFDKARQQRIVFYSNRNDQSSTSDYMPNYLKGN
jgi:hypothetical protein